MSPAQNLPLVAVAVAKTDLAHRSHRVRREIFVPKADSRVMNSTPMWSGSSGHGNASGMCPTHRLPMDRHRLWSSCDVLICPLCDEYVRARWAWLDEVVLPVVDDPDAAMRALVILFNDPRI